MDGEIDRQKYVPKHVQSRTAGDVGAGRRARDPVLCTTSSWSILDDDDTVRNGESNVSQLSRDEAELVRLGVPMQCSSDEAAFDPARCGGFNKVEALADLELPRAAADSEERQMSMKDFKGT